MSTTDRETTVALPWLVEGEQLDPSTLLAGETQRLRIVVDQGVASPEHADFVARLARSTVGGVGRA
jgi:hypothetical protein